MNAIDLVTNDKQIVSNINKQTLFLNRVLLPELEKEIHYIITHNDALVNLFKEKFFKRVVNVLNEIKTSFTAFDNDLTFIEEKLQQALPLVELGDLNDYESYLFDTRYHLNNVLDALELKIEKYNQYEE